MKHLSIYVFLLICLASFAQEKQKDKNLPKANKEYESKNFTQAEAEYRISQSKVRKNEIATYNLGNSIYRQNQASEAKYAYAKAIEYSKTRAEKHQAFHNLGNVYMKEKDYTKAVEAYKNALRNNPNDEETRYNYALAKKMLKDNPPKEDKKDKKKDDKKDKKDDKKEDNKEDKKEDKKDDKKEDKGKDNKPQGQPKPKPEGISKERLQNLLDAVNNEEKKIQDKVNAKKVKGKPIQTEKDW